MYYSTKSPRWYVLLALFAGASLIGAERAHSDTRNETNDVFVEAYGAIPNDGKDDTEAFIRAFAACQKKEHPRLILARGRYDFASRQAPGVQGGHFLTIQNKSRLEIEGNGAELMFADRFTALYIKGCQNVRVRDLSIDWVHPFFSQGKVVSVEGLALEVQVDPEFPVTGKEPINAILDYDPVTRWPLTNLDLLASSAIESVKLVGEQRLRITLKEQSNLEKRAHVHDVLKEMAGRLVVMRHVIYGNQVMSFNDCTNVTVEDVNVYASPGMGLHFAMSKDITLNRVAVKPRPGTNRLMSTTGDAQFFSHVRGFVKITDGHIERAGETPLNVSEKYKTITRVINDTTVEAEVPGPTAEGATPAVGEKIEMCSGDTLVIREVLTVKTSVWDSKTRKFTVSFTTPMSPETKRGDLFAIQTYTPSLELRRSTFRGMRGRAMLLSTRNVLVEDCLIESAGYAAVTFSAGTRSHSQGPASVNTIFRNNTFIGCSGPAIYYGVSVPDPASGIHQNILIENNTIHEMPALAEKRFKRRYPKRVYWNSALSVNNAANVRIVGNDIRGFLYGIHVDRSHNVEVIGKPGSEPTTVLYDPERVERIAIGEGLKAMEITDAMDYDIRENLIPVTR